MRECFNCEFYGLILDESDLPRYGCKNVQSPYYLVWVCSDDYCSRYKESSEFRKSCETCVHSSCHTEADKEACLDCYGFLTNYSEYEPIARPGNLILSSLVNE